MRIATRALGSVGLLVALVVGSYGIWLITTVDREFEPRGSVGVVCVVGAAIVCIASALLVRPR